LKTVLQTSQLAATNRGDSNSVAAGVDRLFFSPSQPTMFNGTRGCLHIRLGSFFRSQHGNLGIALVAAIPRCSKKHVDFGNLFFAHFFIA